LIVLDLEWNRGYDKTPLDEILQIGAVRLDRPGGPITDTFCIFIKPKVHRRLNRTAKELPEIRASQTSELDFPTAYGRFLRWCGEEHEFAAWGCDEIDTLNQNAAYWRLPHLRPRATYDLQAAFSLTLGTAQNIALWWAVEHCQIPECFDYHDALNDAMYTALVTGWIPREALKTAAQPRWALRYAARPFPPQPSRPAGAYPSLSTALNSRECRRGTCPICGQVLWIQSWCHRDDRRFYTDLHCPRHGHFLCRLSLARAADGQWRALQDIPLPTPDVLEDFGLARKAEHYPCTSRRRRRRRRTRRKETIQ